MEKSPPHPVVPLQRLEEEEEVSLERPDLPVELMMSMMMSMMVLLLLLLL